MLEYLDQHTVTSTVLISAVISLTIYISLTVQSQQPINTMLVLYAFCHAFILCGQRVTKQIMLKKKKLRKSLGRYVLESRNLQLRERIPVSTITFSSGGTGDIPA